MKNCIRFHALTVAAFLAGSLSIAAAQSTSPAPRPAAQNQQAAVGPRPDAPKFVITASGEKIPLTSGIEKHVGKVTYLDGPTIIDNRIDSNAILNLESKPLAAKAAEAPAPAPAPEKVAAAATPVARDLKAELKAAKANYAQAKAELKAAQKAKDQTATVTARHDVAAAKDQIAELNREIAASRKKAAK
jgi:hypothetical protein